MSNFPDYEAAMKEMHHLRWAESDMGPLAEKFSPVMINGTKISRISDFDTVKRIVNVALGDETRYVIDRMRLAELKAIPYPLVPEALTMLDAERVLIQVWPRKDNDG